MQNLLPRIRLHRSSKTKDHQEQSTADSLAPISACGWDSQFISSMNTFIPVSPTTESEEKYNEYMAYVFSILVRFVQHPDSSKLIESLREFSAEECFVDDWQVDDLPSKEALDDLLQYLSTSLQIAQDKEFVLNRIRSGRHKTIFKHGPHKILTKLNAGAAGKVYHGVRGDQHLAYKVVPKFILNSKKSLNRLQSEVKVGHVLKHSNLVRTSEILLSKRSLIEVSDLCRGGDLVTFVRKLRRVPENISKRIFWQILRGLQAMHDCSTTHRDIKPENILLVNYDYTSDNYRLKICDFGAATTLRSDEYATETVGTMSYAAPEVLNRESYKPKAVDSWSCGILLYTLLFGALPWYNEGKKLSEAYLIVSESPIPIPPNTLGVTVSYAALDLIKKLLIVSPDYRLSITAALNHAWLLDEPRVFQD